MLALTGRPENHHRDLGPDKAGYWLANVLNRVNRRLRQPDHSFSDLISLFVVRELRRLGVTPAKIREGEAYLRNVWQTDQTSSRFGVGQQPRAPAPG